MAKKKNNQQPKSPENIFRTGMFYALKGVVATADKEVAKPVVAKPEPVPLEDESLIFLQAMDGTRPLDSSRKIRPDTSSSRALNAGQRRTANSPTLEDNDSSPAFMDEIRRLKLEVTFTEENRNEDELKPLAGNRLRHLKRGIVSVEAQLDLHGLSKDEALYELQRFLRVAQTRGEAAVLVITGKGLHSGAEPVLQQAVAGWLREAGRTLITEFAPAPREMGGSGAFVVFLKKLRHRAA